MHIKPHDFHQRVGRVPLKPSVGYRPKERESYIRVRRSFLPLINSAFLLFTWNRPRPSFLLGLKSSFCLPLLLSSAKSSLPPCFLISSFSDKHPSLIVRFHLRSCSWTHCRPLCATYAWFFSTLRKRLCTTFFFSFRRKAYENDFRSSNNIHARWRIRPVACEILLTLVD